MRANAQSGRGKIHPFHQTAGGSQPAVIILIWSYRAAIAKITGLFQCLGKGHIRSNTFSCPFFIIIGNKLLRRNRKRRCRIHPQQILYTLLRSRHRLSQYGLVGKIHRHYRGGQICRWLLRRRLKDGLNSLSNPPLILRLVFRPIPAQTHFRFSRRIIHMSRFSHYRWKKHPKSQRRNHKIPAKPHPVIPP